MGKAFKSPLGKIERSDDPHAGMIHHALGSSEAWCRSRFLALLILLHAWHTALDLTAMCAAYSMKMMPPRAAKCLDTPNGTCY